MSLLDLSKTLEEKFNFKKEATVGGIAFQFSLLNYEQDQLINSFPDEEDDPLSFYEKTRFKVLSYAITKINGEEIPDVVEVQKGDKTETKERAIYVRELLNKIPPTIVEKLFEIYIDFKDETDNRLEKEVEYKWYKTPEQRKEEREKKEKEEKEKKEKEELKEKATEDTTDDISEDMEDQTKSPEIPDTIPPVGEVPPEDKPITFKKIVEKDDSVSQAG